MTELTRQALDEYLKITGGQAGEFLFPGQGNPDRHMTTRQYARLLSEWLSGIGVDPLQLGTHSLRRTKATLIYKKTATCARSTICATTTEVCIIGAYRIQNRLGEGEGLSKAGLPE